MSSKFCAILVLFINIIFLLRPSSAQQIWFRHHGRNGKYADLSQGPGSTDWEYVKPYNYNNIFVPRTTENEFPGIGFHPIFHQPVTLLGQNGGKIITCIPDAYKYQPHTHDCSKYLYCPRSEIFVYQCDHGFLFNAVLGICDYSFNVHCSIVMHELPSKSNPFGINYFEETPSEEDEHNKEEKQIHNRGHRQSHHYNNNKQTGTGVYMHPLYPFWASEIENQAKSNDYPFNNGFWDWKYSRTPFESTTEFPSNNIPVFKNHWTDSSDDNTVERYPLLPEFDHRHFQYQPPITFSTTDQIDNEYNPGQNEEKPYTENETRNMEPTIKPQSSSDEIVDIEPQGIPDLPNTDINVDELLQVEGTTEINTIQDISSEEILESLQPTEVNKNSEEEDLGEFTTKSPLGDTPNVINTPNRGISENDDNDEEDLTEANPTSSEEVQEKNSPEDYDGIERFDDYCFDCGNGKCINSAYVCNGANNCGNLEDEKNCDHLGYEARLLNNDGSVHAGTIQIKINGTWGYVCDNQFDMLAAEVFCREVGFFLGATEVRPNSYYMTNLEKGTELRDMPFLMDEIDCLGDEHFLKECDFNGWGVHRCTADNAAGVVCELPVLKCENNYWSCKSQQECIPPEFVCDNVAQCTDLSDESEPFCNSTNEYRLVNGKDRSEGRLEMKFRGTWGIVCDDTFGRTEAKVFCNSRGFNGDVKVLTDAFGSSMGPIWSVRHSCTGNENSLDECSQQLWYKHNCNHSDNIGIQCEEINIIGYENKTFIEHEK